MEKILVIEDTASVREEILSILRCEDFEAIGAENGGVAVELARRHRPDVILCDILMPEPDGYSVLAALRQDSATATIPFIFLTAKATKEDIRRGMALGADDYLTKPFTAEDLLVGIRARLARRAMELGERERKLDELRGCIVHALPHELKAPLTGILGYAELLAAAAEIKPKDVAEIARAIYELGQRQHRLIQNFLVYAQIELIASDPRKVEQLRAAYTGDARAVVMEAAQQKARRVGRVQDLVVDGVSGVVEMSEDNLRKIVEELVGNAFKFSAPGRVVRVEIAAEPALTLCVRDSGRGMTAAQTADVGAYIQFERKLHEQQGCGLGLIIAKRLAELHGGTLAIESLPDQGTTVRVSLPGRKKVELHSPAPVCPAAA